MEHRAFLKAADKCWTRVNGQRLEPRQTGTKIRPNCWTVTRNIAAAELGTRGILSLQLCQGKARLFLQRRCHMHHPRVTSGIQLWRGWIPPVLQSCDMVLGGGTATMGSGLAPAFAPASRSHPSPAMLRLWDRMGEEVHSQAHLTAHESSWHPYISNPDSAGSPSPSSEGQGKFSPIAAPTFYLEKPQQARLKKKPKKQKNVTNNPRKRIQQPLKPHPTVEREGWRQGKKASVKPHYHQKSSLLALTSLLISISQGTQYLSSLEKHPIFAEPGCPHPQH